MHNNDAQITEMLIKLSNGYSNVVLDTDKMEVYLSAFQGCELNLLAQTFDVAIESCKFFPSVAELYTIYRTFQKDKYLREDGKINCHFCLGTGFREVSRRSRDNRMSYKGVIRCNHEDGYRFTDGDEIVGADEGIRIIESYLARQGLEFNVEIKNVLYAKFNR